MLMFESSSGASLGSSIEEIRGAMTGVSFPAGRLERPSPARAEAELNAVNHPLTKVQGGIGRSLTAMLRGSSPRRRSIRGFRASAARAEP